MKRPKISIVVPAYNSENTINACVTSLLNQNHPNEEYEIIVVDNGSTDNNLKILQKFKNKIVVLHEPIKGSYRARNQGVKHAQGSIILFTDSDCFADKNWIRNMISMFKKTKVKIVGGPIKAARRENAMQKYCDLFSHPQKDYYKTKKFASSNIAVRKIDLLKAGLFNEQLLSGGDFEFCSRLIKNTEEICYEPNAIVYHYYSKSILVFMKKNFRYGIWNRVIRKKHKKQFHIKTMGYLEILRNFGLTFVIFKILQDFSFKSGFLFGLLLSK
jgi:glycosyltransferase involved in cell wall biosynthesis